MYKIDVPQCSQIAEAVKKCVKEMNFPRYKLITTVAVGQCT